MKPRGAPFRVGRAQIAAPCCNRATVGAALVSAAAAAPSAGPRHAMIRAPGPARPLAGDKPARRVETMRQYLQALSLAAEFAIVILGAFGILFLLTFLAVVTRTGAGDPGSTGWY